MGPSSFPIAAEGIFEAHFYCKMAFLSKKKKRRRKKKNEEAKDNGNVTSVPSNNSLLSHFKSGKLTMLNAPDRCFLCLLPNPHSRKLSGILDAKFFKL